MSLYEWLKRFVDAVAPAKCAGCGVPGSIFCADCVGRVQWIERPICESCGVSLKGEQTLCFSCMKFRPKLHTRAAVCYNDPISPAIHAFKYTGSFALAQPLAQLMVTAWGKWRNDFQVDVVAPVPLHAKRFQERGYNQSEKLAQAFAPAADLPLDINLLFRTKHTRPQAELDARKRVGNVQAAFAVAGEVNGKHILLIDDVVTTGSTLLACAHALLDEGAASVNAYCLARAEESTNGSN